MVNHPFALKSLLESPYIDCDLIALSTTLGRNPTKRKPSHPLSLHKHVSLEKFSGLAKFVCNSTQEQV